MADPQQQPKPQSDPQKSWQARVAESTDAIAQEFVESISYDKRLYKHDIAGSLAHAAMLAKVGLITEDERAKIEQGLRSIERDIEADNLEFDISNEDIHMVVEAELINRSESRDGSCIRGGAGMIRWMSSFEISNSRLSASMSRS